MNMMELFGYPVISKEIILLTEDMKEDLKTLYSDTIKPVCLTSVNIFFPQFPLKDMYRLIIRLWNCQY